MATTLPKETLNEIKEILLEKEEELEGRLVQLQEEDPFANEDKLAESVDSGAESADQFDHERVRAMEQEIQESLKEVREALADVENGEYGICEICGKPIDPKRLKIKPMAQLCVKCEQEEERE